MKHEPLIRDAMEKAKGHPVSVGSVVVNLDDDETYDLIAIDNGVGTIVQHRRTEHIPVSRLICPYRARQILFEMLTAWRLSSN